MKKVKMWMQISCSVLVVFMGFFASVSASETVIEKVKVDKKANATYTFTVTISHADKSWDHYANLWQVETTEGKVLGRRVLHHPHVNEQPFTRALSGVKIPKGVDEVIVRAGCNVDGLNSQPVVVKL